MIFEISVINVRPSDSTPSLRAYADIRLSPDAGSIKILGFSMVSPTDAQSGRAKYFRNKCKAHACPVCGPRKLRRVCRRIGEVAHAKQLQRFVTLTLDPAKIPTDQTSLKYLRTTWRKMPVSLQRYLGGSVEFIAVVETHKSGVTHLHVLVGTYLPKEWLSQAWQGVGGGQDLRYSLGGCTSSCCILVEILHQRTASNLTPENAAHHMFQRDCYWGTEAGRDRLVSLQTLY